MDDNKLKRIILNFEKKYIKNQVSFATFFIFLKFSIYFFRILGATDQVSRRSTKIHGFWGRTSWCHKGIGCNCYNAWRVPYTCWAPVCIFFNGASVSWGTTSWFRFMNLADLVWFMSPLDFFKNADISVAVVDLLQELTDVDTLHESEEGTDALITALCDGQVWKLSITKL